MYVCIDLFQVSAEIQDYLTNRITKGHVPSYQLYLHLNDMLKLAVNIPPKYACLYVHTYVQYICMYVCMTICVHTYCVQTTSIMYVYTHTCACTHTHTHTHTHTYLYVQCKVGYLHVAAIITIPKLYSYTKISIIQIL